MAAPKQGQPARDVTTGPARGQARLSPVVDGLTAQTNHVTGAPLL
jgi:hypothetical protein